jgi:hypothetical protein
MLVEPHIEPEIAIWATPLLCSDQRQSAEKRADSQHNLRRRSADNDGSRDVSGVFRHTSWWPHPVEI